MPTPSEEEQRLATVTRERDTSTSPKRSRPQSSSSGDSSEAKRGAQNKRAGLIPKTARSYSDVDSSGGTTGCQTQPVPTKKAHKRGRKRHIPPQFRWAFHPKRHPNDSTQRSPPPVRPSPMRTRMRRKHFGTPTWLAAETKFVGGPSPTESFFVGSRRSHAISCANF